MAAKLRRSKPNYNQMSLFAPPPLSVVMPGCVVERSVYQDPFLRYHAAALEAAGDAPVPLDEDTWDHDAHGAVGCDVESFINYFVVCFKRFVDGKRVAFELSERCPELNKRGIVQILNSNTIVTFNGLQYDLPIIFKALEEGVDTVTLKRYTEKLIFDDIKPWEIEKKLGIRVPRHIQHIDLMEPNPAVRQGLKIIHGRLHGRFMVDLPFGVNEHLTRSQMNVATLYCHNDLDATEGLYVACRELLELRADLGKVYSTDFRCKSDAQIGETIVKKKAKAISGDTEYEGEVPQDFMYEVPAFVKFDNAQMNSIVDRIRETTFAVAGSGHPIAPAWLEKCTVNSIGKMVYSMGIGGLHSTEAHRSLVSDEKRFLMDVDVASQYPNIIMKLGLFPPKLGPAFLEVYGGIIKERLAAKEKMRELEKLMREEPAKAPELKKEHTYYKVRADGGRIALNGVYGKLGSSYSVLHAPNHVIAITLTGQLAILMLIERAEAAGIPVVSANTDGVVFHCPRVAEQMLDAILKKWEADTGFEIERTFYKALYNSSVNTYIAIGENGKVKRKGHISDPWTEGDKRGMMMKNPAMTICSEAIVRYLVDDKPLQETIRACQDPRAFVTVVKVEAGGVWRGARLGRAVRYYWSQDGDPIMWSNGSKKVSKTDGAKPLFELTDELPKDIDYLRYYQEAVSLAIDLAIPGF